jgi:hypothetical protein
VRKELFMPARDKIQQEILNAKNAAQDNIRKQYLKELNEHTKRDTILYASSFASKKLPQLPGFLISITNEDIQGFMSSLNGLKGDKLDLILHSPGGSLEAAEQIVNYLRAKYKHIRAIVPQNAMSAATMIACACDEIVMGKQSAIGPIDPQITFPTQNGHFTAPAQSIINEFNQAKAEIIADPKVAPIWVNKIHSLPHGILDICQNTTKLAKEKVSTWLEAYMFKGEADAKAKADKIATWLGNADLHKTHGKPICMKEAKEQGFKIVKLESEQEFQDKVLSVYHATLITLEITNCIKFIENHDGKGWYLAVNINEKQK